MKKLLSTILVLTSLGVFAQEGAEVQQNIRDRNVLNKMSESSLDCSDIQFPEYRGLNDVKCAIKLKKNLNKRNSDNETALIIAARRGHIKTTRLLVGAKGVNLNAQDFSGVTALYQAAQRGHYNIAKTLINAKGIDVNLDSFYELSTPLMKALATDNRETAKLLVSSPKIDINKMNNNGASAFDYAMIFKDAEFVRAMFKKADLSYMSEEEIQELKDEFNIE